MTLIMKGSEVSAGMKARILDELHTISITPTLAVIRVGSRPDDLAYERGIIKRFDSLGLNVKVHELPENISQNDFDSAFMNINNDPNIHGILLFRPLPDGLSDEFAVRNINPVKDVDCMSDSNIAGVFACKPECFAPCTASAVMEMLSHYDINLQGMNVTVIGRSMVIGRPVSMMMMKQNATVTICHTKTKNIQDICRRSDIIIAAAGKALMLTSDYVNENSIIVDVGINVDENGKLCGDVDFQNVSSCVKAISPVPGGVGAVTTSVLAEHVVKAAKLLS